MTCGFLLFPGTSSDESKISSAIRVELENVLMPNRRTKFESTNLEIYRGDDEYFNFRIFEGGDYYNLTDNTIRIIGRSTRSSESLFDIDIVDGDNESDFKNGLIVVLIPSSITSDLPSIFKYDIQSTDAEGKIKTLVHGQIKSFGEYVYD